MPNIATCALHKLYKMYTSAQANVCFGVYAASRRGAKGRERQGEMAHTHSIACSYRLRQKLATDD